MQRKRIPVLAAVTAATAVLAMVQPSAAAVAVGQAPLTTAQAAALSQNVNTPVIVVLANQPAQQAANSPAAVTRDNAIAASQSSLVSELSQVKATHMHQYRLVNAISATVSPAEASRLSANPGVAQVLPDSILRGPLPRRVTRPAGGRAAQTSELPGECPAPGKVMLEPEALDVTHTQSDDPNARTARSLGFTGTGVRVADLADGVDINNPDFIRPDGSHVFADYQDFTGDGPNAPTNGGEAFEDYSAIAAQGRQIYNVQNFGAQPLPTACDLRVVGMAPGAGLYGFKIFGQTNTSPVSAALEGIDYAVNVDHVNVINESFGPQPSPDNGATDALKLFDDAAVAAGVTVAVSSGDAGTQNTESSPQTDPKVIAAGASTTFRFYAQTNFNGASTFAKTGWLNDNVSSLSSSGFTAAGVTINVLAPGDLSFSICTADVTLYSACTNLVGQPSPVELSGGTSESAPLTAGTAALVIQAYRQTHNGATPSPALIKQIITSTADDLTEPGAEQGSGLLDSYTAVQAALSIHDTNGTPAATGSTLMLSQNQLLATGATGSTQRFDVDVTNTGAHAQTVRLAGRTFGPVTRKQTGSVTLDDTTSPHFTDGTGNTDNFGTVTFTVPPNTDRLSASIAYPGNPNGSFNAQDTLDLIDPLGRFAANSVPQGIGDYGNADVRLPVAGTWTAVIFGAESANGGTAGKVLFEADTQNTTGFGSVSPSVLRLAPGQTGSVTVTERTPSIPGDVSGSLVLDTGNGPRTSAPIVLRSLVAAHGSGAFTGTLNGGNGRMSDAGQSDFFQIDVPPGQRDLDANVALTNDLGDLVQAFLIDPHGNAVATGNDELPTSYDPVMHNATQQPQLQTDLYVRDPRPGRWTLIIVFVGAVVGDEISQPFTGNLTFNQVAVAAPGLPDNTSTTLRAGKPVTVPIAVRNNGNAAEDVFVDPRLAGFTPVALAGQNATDVPLPLPAANGYPEWLLPSESVAATVIAKATLPNTFDFGTLAGDPDLPADVSGTTAVGSITGNPLPTGPWLAGPSEVGTFGPNGAPPGSTNFTMTALTRTFDPTITAPATDLWTNAVTPAAGFTIVTVNPGQTVTIPVTITPIGTKGSVVSGTLFVDELNVSTSPSLNDTNFNDLNNFEPNADELVGLPYRYEIG